MWGSCSAGIEGKCCKFVLYSVFDGEPVQGLQPRGVVISGAGTNDNYGESILDTLDTCYVVFDRLMENGLLSPSVTRRVNCKWLMYCT